MENEIKLEVELTVIKNHMEELKKDIEGAHANVISALKAEEKKEETTPQFRGWSGSDPFDIFVDTFDYTKALRESRKVDEIVKKYKRLRGRKEKVNNELTKIKRK